MSETMPLAAVEAHLSEVVDRVQRTHERVTITRRYLAGQPRGRQPGGLQRGRTRR